MEVAATLDALKDAGFHWATRSGVTVAISDVVTPPHKPEILEGYEEKAAKVQTQYETGLITDDERRQELIEIWTQATNEVAKAMEANFPRTTPSTGWCPRVLVVTGCRSATSPVCVAWCPTRRARSSRVRSSRTYREGLSVLEYFIATHGARKGLADTALRTADSGYLTRRLVDVSQDVIIREDDCGTDRGLDADRGHGRAHGNRTVHDDVETSVYARTLAEDVVEDGEVLAAAGIDVGDVVIDALIEAGVDAVKVRSVLTCDSAVGICAPATAARSRPASSSTSARPSASSRPSRSVSPARS